MNGTFVPTKRVDVRLSCVIIFGFKTTVLSVSSWRALTKLPSERNERPLCMMISPMTPRSKPFIKGTLPVAGLAVALVALIPGAMLFAFETDVPVVLIGLEEEAGL